MCRDSRGLHRGTGSIQTPLGPAYAGQGSGRCEVGRLGTCTHMWGPVAATGWVRALQQCGNRLLWNLRLRSQMCVLTGSSSNVYSREKISLRNVCRLFRASGPVREVSDSSEVAAL